ncbi:MULTISPECIES: four helix bundle protein [Reichenbachiella]|uniref:Four helix bundle protein n=1 Tax=Reichenbachiella agariperforans TaxID=156994 RepID=A0A1M6RXX6_REIAG|nr:MULTISPECIES: four helix bundle protein [Reichenbachiella]RJE70411.1 four helix bundle protein [Reichenbachiella sp. MSK19-1]SHK37169.1 four helix bundle protein [Reichenbachiella agariperforans]
MHKYKELKVWKKAMDLVEEVYSAVKKFPDDEKFGLTSQMKRCSTSIPSNIAEGAGRNTGKDFNRFLDMAVGSLFELETQTLLSARLGFMPNENQEVILKQISEIHLMTIGLKKSLV